MKNMLKRLLGIFVAAAMLISAFSFTTFATADFTTHVWETFEDGQDGAIRNSDTTFTSIDSKYGKGAKYTYNHTKQGKYTQASFALTNPITLADAVKNNLTVEVEFDYYVKDRIGGNDNYFHITSGENNTTNAAKFEIRSNGQTKIWSPIKTDKGDDVKNSNADAIKTFGTFKIVFHAEAADFTDKFPGLDSAKTTVASWVLDKFYYNGVDTVTSAKYVPGSVIATCDFTHLYFRFKSDSTKVGEIGLDNVSVTSYTTSQDGVSPVPDRYALFNKITAAKTNVEGDYSSGSFDETVYNKLKADIAAIDTTIAENAITKAVYDKAIADIAAVEKTLTVYKAMKDSGKNYYIDESEAKINGDFDTDNEITVDFPIYMKGNSTPTLKMAAFIYEDDVNVATPKLLTILTEDVQISEGKASAAFDLSTLTTRSSAKLAVVESYAELSTEVAQAYAGTEADAAVGDGYTFSGDVNVSKERIGETDDFKFVFALNGTEGARVALLVQKPDTKLSELATTPVAVTAYYNSAVFDEEGRAVFEFMPDGIGEYSYYVNCADYQETKTGSVFYASLGDINNVIGTINSEKSFSGLSENDYKALSLDKALIDASNAAGVNTDNVLKEALAEVALSADTLSDFTGALNKKLNIVKDFCTAESSTAVEELFETHKNDVDMSQIEALPSSSSVEFASKYVYARKSKITDIASLEELLEKAAAAAIENEDAFKNAQIHFLSSLEDNTNGFSVYNSTAQIKDDVTFAEDTGYGTVVKSVAEDSIKNGIDVTLDESVTLEENRCVEIEFDMIITPPADKTFSNQIKVAPNATNFMFFSNANAFETEGSDSNGRHVTGLTLNEMNRYKITLKGIDKDGTLYWGLTSFKVNTAEKLTSGKTYTSTKLKSDLTSIRFRYGNNSAGDTFCLDNVSVISYISEDGSSPTPDRYAILSKARTAGSAVKKSLDDGKISQEVFGSINAKIDSALAVMYNKASKTADYAAAAESLDSVENMLKAYETLEDGEYYADNESAVVTGDILIDDEVTVAIPIYTASGTESVQVKTIGFLYEENENFATPQLVDIVEGSATIPANTVGEAGATFDITAYADRETLCMKVVALDSYNEILTSAKLSEAATKEEDAVQSGYIYSDGINMYKDILSDDTNEENYKFVCTIKGTPGKKVSLLVLKKGKTFDDVTVAPSTAIEYFATAVLDSDGNAAFEFMPQTAAVMALSTEGEYNSYRVNVEGAPSYDERILPAQRTAVQAVLDKVKSEKTMNTLSTEEKYTASLNSQVLTGSITSAGNSGVNTDNVLSEVITLMGTEYKASNLLGFVQTLAHKNDVVTSFRVSDSADTVMTLLGSYSADIPSSGDISALGDAQKKQNAYVYINNNKNSIVNLTTLSNVVAAAAENPNGDGGNGGDDGGYDGGGGSGGGGGRGTGAIVISPAGAPAENDENKTVMQEALNRFTDLTDVKWAESAICEFAANGFINGKAEGVFAPNDKITREEFVKIVVNVFGFYNENARCSFSDTNANSWHYAYIASAAENGIVNGLSENSFGVGATVTRQDMAVILYRIARLANLNLTEDGEYLPFADEIHISDYAFEPVTELTKSGIINGMGNNSFQPQGLATRAEAVKMIYEAYKLK